MILQLAREQAEKAGTQGAQSDAGMTFQAGDLTSEEAASAAAVSASSSGSFSVFAITSTPLGFASAVNPPSVANAASSLAVSVGNSAAPTNAAVMHSPAATGPAFPPGVSGDAGASPAINANSGSM